MAQNLYPPMALLKKTAQQYPKAWELMANFHAENGMNGLPTWPDWCYAPMSAAVAIASGGRNFLLLPVNQQQDIINSAQKLFALATWRLSKEVYQLDPDFAQLLFEQTNDLDIPSEIFLQLPYPCFYIEVPDLFFGAKPIHGFFVNLEYDVNNGDRELQLYFLYQDGTGFGYPIHIDEHTISDNMAHVAKEALYNSRNDKFIQAQTYQAIQETDALQELLLKALQVVLYILASNAEIVPNSEQSFITKRGATIKDKYSEIRKWDVGIRIGAAIRQKSASVEKGESTKTASGHSSPRPHMRRGHWHHYWTGPRNVSENRRLILKWLSPMAVAATPEDAPIVIHEIKNNF